MLIKEYWVFRYGLFAKFRATAIAALAFVTLAALAVLFDLETIRWFVVGCVLLVFNVLIDLLNLQNFGDVILTADTIKTGGKEMRLTEITEISEFGPTIGGASSTISRQQLFASGVIVRSNDGELVIRSSLENFKAFWENLEKLMAR